MVDSAELEVDSVIFSYDTTALLNNIYLKCQYGDIVGLLGRNGSGKSTLLKIIYGVQKAQNANIRVNKTPYKYLFLQKNMISYLPQHSFLPKSEKVKTIIKLYIKNKKEQNELFENSRINKLLKQNTGTLSGGELKYLELLLLIRNNSRFLLLDEPFSGIEPIYKDIIKEQIHTISSKCGIIITDHDYVNILDTCNQTILLTQGATTSINDNKELVRYGYLLDTHLKS